MKIIEYILRLKIRYHITVVTGVLIIISVMAFTTVSMILSVAKDSAKENAENNFKVSSLTAIERTGALLEPAINLSSMTAHIPDIDTPPVSESGMEHPAYLFFSSMLREYKAFYSVYIGLADGSFFQVINAENRPSVKEAHNAPYDTVLILRTIFIQGDFRIQTFTFLDSYGEILHRDTSDNFDYEPRGRTWYQDALKYNEPVLSNPYVFNSLKKPGITVSCKIPGKSGVVGVDLTISQLASFISEQKISENGGIALFTDEKQELACSDEVKDFLGSINESEIKTGRFYNESVEIMHDNILFQSEVWDTAVNRNLVFMSAAPLSDFMKEAVTMQNKILLFPC